mgnify:CR=1 FL=1
MDGYEIGRSETPLAFETGVDLDVCETKYEYVGQIREAIMSKQMTEEQLTLLLNTQNNIAESTIMLIQTHKPGRYTIKELQETIKRKDENKKELIRKQLEK